MIDTTFATSIGGGGGAGVDVQVGDLLLTHASAAPGDLQGKPYAQILGHAVDFRIGEEVFNQLAVDIDFVHHRVRFRDPKTVTRPAGAVEVPVVELDSERVVPLSIDGGAPAQFELELGNTIGPLLASPAYAESHKLLEGHPTSQRLSGRFVETVVTIDHLGFAGVDLPHVPIALIPDTQLPPASITGGVGLPVFAKFDLTIDYSHNRIYATPVPAAVTTPIAKDRIGLILGANDGTFGVAFVAPHSPADLAGFKKGEKIELIDGKPFAAWNRLAIHEFYLADVGTTHAFTMPDGTVRQVKAADFF